MKQSAFFFLGIFLIVNSTLRAQERGTAPLNGIVTILNSKTETGRIKYVSTAAIYADKANPTLTNSEGQFRLVFIDASPGEEVKLDIQKGGLEVVNKEALRTILRKDPSSLLKVYMCDPEKLASSILILQGTAEKYITEKYIRKIAQLEKEKKQAASAVLKLQNEKDLALRQFKEIAQKLATVNLDDASGTYRQAQNLFESGNLDGALQLIQQADLEGQLSAAREQRDRGQQLIEQSQEHIAEIANTYMLKARMNIANLAFDSATVAYQQAIAALDSTNMDDNLEYALFQVSQNQGWRVLSLLKHTALLAEKNVPVNAYSHLLLGTAYLNQVEVDSAILYLTSSLQQYADLVTIDSIKYGAFSSVAIMSCAIAHLFNSNQSAAAEIAAYGSQIFGYLMAIDETRYFPFYNWAEYINVALSGNFNKIDKVINNFQRLARDVSPQYEVFLGPCKLLKALHLRDSLRTPNLDAAVAKSLSKEADDLEKAAVDLISTQLQKVDRSFPNVGFVFSGPNQLPSFETLMESTDFPTGIILSGVQMWWLQGIMSAEQDSQSEPALLQLAVEKTKMLAGQNRDRYLPLFAQYTGLLGYDYILKDQPDKAFPLLEEALGLLNDPTLKANPSYDFINGMLLALKCIAQSIQYAGNGEFYQTDKATLLSEIQSVKSVIEKYPTLIYMEEMYYMLSIFERGLERTHDSKAFKQYYLYQEGLRQFKLAADQQDEGQMVFQYQEAMEHAAALLQKDFNTEDALILEAMNADWRDAVFANQPDSLMASYRREIILEEKIMRYDCTAQDHLRERTATNCGNLAWYCLLNKDYTSAANYAAKGMAVDPRQTWMVSNIGHSRLLRGQFKKALRIYAEWYNQPHSLDATMLFRDALLGDFQQLADSGFVSPDLTQAVAMVKGETAFPDILTKGLESLQQARKLLQEGNNLWGSDDRKAAGLWEGARFRMEQILKIPFVNSGYFDEDAGEIWTTLKTIAFRLKKGTPVIPLEWDAALMNAAALQLQNKTAAQLLCADSLDLEQTLIQIDAAVDLARTAVSQRPEIRDYSTDLATCLAQQTQVLLLAGRAAEAWEAAQAALAIEGQSPQVNISWILAACLVDKTKEARSRFLLWKHQTWPGGDFNDCEEALLFFLRQLEHSGQLASADEMLRYLGEG